MTMLPSEIQWTHSALTSGTVPAQNGGRFTENVIVSDVKNNLFPDVTGEQRRTGITQSRKVFIGVRNAENLTLVDPRISLEAGTPGESYLLLYPGTQTDTADTRSARPYGYGTLAADADVGATEITIATEADFSAMADPPFQAGDLIRLDARPTASDEGSVEYPRIDAVSYAAEVVTITLVDGLTYSYTAADGVHVASVIEPDDIAARYESLSVTGGITFDDATYPPIVPGIGGIYQTWTVTVTDAANGTLSVTGDTLPGTWTGATGVDLAPANPNGGTYFTLPADGWGGTPVDGDTLTFTSLPAATPVWYDRVVPVGAETISNDGANVLVYGDPV